MATLHRDMLFAPLDADLHLERIAGGNETEVYCSDDRCYVVKVKCEEAGTPEIALTKAISRRHVAQVFANAIGERHRIPTYFIVAATEGGGAQPVAVQPYYHHAQPLFSVDYSALSRRQRRWVVRQLLDILGRNIRTLLTQGWMPDIYGRTNTNSYARKSSNAWWMLPWRLWGFLFKRNLLRAHNFLLTSRPTAALFWLTTIPSHMESCISFSTILCDLPCFCATWSSFLLCCTRGMPRRRSCAILSSIE